MNRVAVIVPHYRQGAYLGRCLDSLLLQTRLPDEIVVVDSSPEETVDIQRQYSHRARFLAQPPQGVAGARNMGMAATTSDLVAFLDADNVALPDRLERQLGAFEANRDAILCHGALVNVDRDGTTYAGLDLHTSTQMPFDRQLGWLISRNQIATDTVCVKREVVAGLGAFCETQGVREDYDLWLRMAPLGPFQYVDAPLAVYRRHDTNLSNNEAYMFEWEAGALKRIDWETTSRALQQAFPDESERLVTEGEVRLRRGEVDLAERHFVWLARQSKAAGALFHLAHLSITRGMLDNAEALLRRALNEEPENAALWNNLGVVLARNAHSSEATGAFSHAMDLRPQYEDARQNLTLLMEGKSGPWRLTRRRLRPQLMPLSAQA